MELTDLAPKLTAAEKSQAETFMKVLSNKKYSVDEMANILGHCGKILLAHAEDLAGEE